MMTIDDDAFTQVKRADCLLLTETCRARYTGWRKKRPEHLHALFTRTVEINQCKSMYVMTKHLRICVGILA